MKAALRQSREVLKRGQGIHRELCFLCTTTMGAAVDLENEGLRRLLVNACYWATGLEDKTPAKANVDYVAEYRPEWFGFGKFKKGLKPADWELKP